MPASKVTDSPAQTAVSFPKSTIGKAFIVNTTESLSAHPFISVTFTT